MDQRIAERIDTRVPTRLVMSNGQAVGAVIRDISVGGLFLETAESLYPYTCVDVCVQVPGESGTYTVPAVVTNTRRQGVGMKFSAIDHKLCNVLNRLAMRRAEDTVKRRVA